MSTTDPLANWKWYSICSAHQKRDPDCPRCNVGEWINVEDPEVKADHQLFKDDPDAWREKHKGENIQDSLTEWIEGPPS